MSLMVIISALLLTAATTLTHLCLAPSAMLQIREPISTVPISQWHPQSQDAFESLFFFSFLSFFLFLHICSSGGLLDFKNENYVVSLSVFFFFLPFWRPHPWHMEIPRLGLKSELQSYATATVTTVMPDLSRICDIHCSS